MHQLGGSSTKPLLASRGERAKNEEFKIDEVQIYARSPRKIDLDRTLLSTFNPATDCWGSSGRGLSYKLDAEGYTPVDVKELFPYLDAVSLDSWSEELATCIIKAGLFFIGNYANLTFVSRIFQLEATSTNANWAIALVMLANLVTQLVMAGINARMQLDRDNNELVLNLSCSGYLQRLRLCLSLLVLHFVSAPSTLRRAPILLHPAKDAVHYAAVKLLANKETGVCPRVHFVGYSSQADYEVDRRTGQVHHIMIALCLGLILNVLKIVVWLRHKHAIGLAVSILTVGLPLCILVYDVMDWIELRKHRATLWNQLEKDEKSYDPSIKHLASKKKKHEFAWCSKVEDSSGSNKRPAQPSLCAARMLADKAIDLALDVDRHCKQLNMAYIQPLILGLLGLSFPCAFPVQDSRRTRFLSNGFPFGLGPIALWPARLPVHSLGTKDLSEWDDVSLEKEERVALGIADNSEFAFWYKGGHDQSGCFLYRDRETKVVYKALGSTGDEKDQENACSDFARRCLGFGDPVDIDMEDVGKALSNQPKYPALPFLRSVLRRKPEQMARLDQLEELMGKLRFAWVPPQGPPESNPRQVSIDYSESTMGKLGGFIFYLDEQSLGDSGTWHL